MIVVQFQVTLCAFNWLLRPEAAKTVPVISVILLRFYKNAQGCQSGIHRNIDEGCLAVTKMQKKHRADAKNNQCHQNGV